jgi:hypothetical protein
VVDWMLLDLGLWCETEGEIEVRCLGWAETE